jgi:hypothetical protein
VTAVSVALALLSRPALLAVPAKVLVPDVAKAHGCSAFVAAKALNLALRNWRMACASNTP